MNLQGALLGLCTFLIIGLCHPIVIKAEYYFGTRPWWAFLLVGVAGTVAALLIRDFFWSSLCAITGFSFLWGIKELFDQEKRVQRGWFPKNPKRRYKDASGGETRNAA
ncbi:MAG: DUF4491 family protein [Alloprevotella sp.]|nr:DUF4491 family protein [Prevotella sp.]MBR1712788.1 DUF4491 family protein [Alloprevotella sp.]